MTLLLALLVAAAIAAGGLAILGASSRAHPPADRPPATDRDEVTRLAPCPASPNCVTSLPADPRHAVAPIPFSGPPGAAWERLRTLLLAMPGARLAAERPGYLHVEFMSGLFGFVDDAEFVLDAAAGRIDVRSASRVGWGDLGANRRRIESITRRFVAPS